MAPVLKVVVGGDVVEEEHEIEGSGGWDAVVKR